MSMLLPLLRSKYMAGMAGVLCAALACVALWRDGYVRGKSVVQSAWDGERARTAAEIVKNMEVERVRNDLADQSRAADREKQRGTFRAIRRDVVRVHVDATDCNLHDDGLRLWNAANANAASADVPGQPDGEVPDVADGDQREAGRPDQ
jgi:hypothetical protein